MCGIIGYLGPKEAVPVILEGLKKLEYRGYDSAGIAVVREDDIHIRRVKGKIQKLEETLRESPLDGDYGLGHTRWATHGRPSEENAHPHRDCSGTIVVVHNGIIENYLELKRMLQEEKHVFQTETDTEVIAHLIERNFENSLEQAVNASIVHLEGAFAFAVISSRDPGKIVVVKAGPPAVIGVGDGEWLVSSDINPILSHTRKVVFLNDQEMAVITQQEAKYFDFQGNPLTKKALELAWNPLMVEKKGFKHFMLKEIFEQPQVVRDTLQGRVSLDSGAVFLEEVRIFPEVLRELSRVVIIACGTSYHAGLIGGYLVESLAKIPVDVEYASEYRYRDFILDKNCLVVVISQSGETADSLAALRAVKRRGLPSLAICNVMGSSIAREADSVLYTHAGPEIGVAATKTFSAQLTALELLALYLAQLKGTLEEKKILMLIEELQRIPHKMERILHRAREIEELAARFVLYSHFLYLGRGLNFPVALEGALKLKEISYIHAEAYPGGEMKHGPIALIDDKMPTMVIVPKDRVYEKMLSNISEVRARSGYLLAVAYEDDREIMGIVHDVLLVPESMEFFTPFLTVLPLQLFAYYIAAKKGLDVDQPRNLAKSVTVE